MTTPGARRPAVFVDRDGTLNREVHYLRRVADLRLLPGTAAAVRRLTAAGFAVVVVTNQSGVARGLIAPATLDAIHATLRRRLARAGAHLAGLYVCLHHPTAGTPPLRRRCRCRKPAPGMVTRAAHDLGLDLARSYGVGDSVVDLGLAAAAGLRAVLVRTGQGRGTEVMLDGPAPTLGRRNPAVDRRAPALDRRAPAAHVAANFRAAADWIIDDARRRSAQPRHPPRPRR